MASPTPRQHSHHYLSNGHGVPNAHGPGRSSPQLGFGTRAIHVGSEPDAETGAVIPSISLSTTYKQTAVGEHKGFEYSRCGNPNRDDFEASLASLEVGGAYAITFSSGSAATATMIQSLGVSAHLLSVNDVYGGTFRFMTRVAESGQGMETTFLDMESATTEEVIAEIRHNTKLIWLECPTNPTLRVIDIQAIISIARSHPARPLVLVDDTFLSPYYASPLLLGADVVLHSISKYINGHSDVIMGSLVLPARHAALEKKLRFMQNAIGAIPSPFDCWLAHRGTKTLHLRMKAHGTNALAVAKALEASPYVQDVIYPGLASHPRHELAYKALSPHARKWIDSLPGTEGGKGDFPYSGVISFRTASSPSSTAAAAARKFLRTTKLFTLAESLGGVESLAELPADMTHAAIPEEERELIGIGSDLIRLSVGLEDPEDLVADVEQALLKASHSKDT